MKHSNKKEENSVVKVLKVLGDINRLKIFCLLAQQKNKVCVTTVAEKLDITVANASYHLRILTRNGILEPERDGITVCYVLKRTGPVLDLKSYICKYFE